MAPKPLSLLLILSLLLSLSLKVYTLSNTPPSDEDEDLSFLLDDDLDDATLSSDPADPLQHYSGEEYGEEGEFDQSGYENYDDDDMDQIGDGEPDDVAPVFDEKDVVVLAQPNFTDFIKNNSIYFRLKEFDADVAPEFGQSNFIDFTENNRYVMVEFYAPWCGHCQSLAPEYAAAATELKGAALAAVLAKVDATEESQLAQEYGIEGFPTVLFFVDGVKKEYPGQRTKDAIVTWVKKKTGPGIYNLTTVEDAERVLKDESKVVLGFLDSLMGQHSDELAAASRLEEDVSFYQTSSADVAKLFHIDAKAKLPSLVLLKKEAEKISFFDGEFTKSTIVEFVSKNKLPLVTQFTRESAPLIFENPIKKQLLLFATANDTAHYLTVFQEASKAFKGKLIFVYVEMDDEDVGRPVSEYFGVSGDAPRVIGYTGNDEGKKFVLDGKLTLSSIKSFGEDFLEDKLKPFYKSDPIPETNDGDVKIVVGNNFEDIVLDESKDVLLEIYAPWCGHCQSLEPIYNKLAKHLKSIDSIVIAKMDGTTNEHPRAKADGFPTLLFFPAGNKSFDPVAVDADRTVVAFYKFLKKNAAIPFKLQKPASTEKPKESDTTESQTSDDDSNLKDEL